MAPLRCRSSCTSPGFPSPCWSSLRDCSSECLFWLADYLTDCSSECLFWPADYLTDCSSSSWRECGLCTEIHRCCWDPCSTYKTEKKISHHYCEVLVGSKGFQSWCWILTYLSSIRASRLAWPHFRLWSLLEHFLVITNPARNPRRIETRAVVRQATDNVFSEYWWGPPRKVKL